MNENLGNGLQINASAIMKASFGETGNKVRVSLKKTVQLRQYETEVVEVAQEVELQNPVSGAERYAIASVLEAQAEIAVYQSFVQKGRIEQAEFDERLRCLTEQVKVADGWMRYANNGTGLEKYLG